MDVLGPALDPGVRAARRRDPGEVALDVGEEDGHALGGQLLGDQLERLGLAGAGGARDQAVAVEHRQRHPDLRVRQALPVPQQGAQLQGGSGEGVAGGDLQGLLGEGGSALRHFRSRGRRHGLAVRHIHAPVPGSYRLVGFFFSVALRRHGCARNVLPGRLSV
ncbi:hypothetical protein GCM10011428_64490 [Streptomyces violaceus]